MKKRFVFLMMLLFLVNVVFSIDISDYPHFFVHGETFDPAYVIGTEAPSTDVVSATILSTAIAQYPEYTVKIGTSKTDDEVSDVKKINAIVIGNPCVNKAAAELEGNPSFCYQGLEGGKGYAKLFSNNGKYQLLITGVSAEDRKAMAEFLAERYLGDLDVTTYSISSYSGSKTPEKPSHLDVDKTVSVSVEKSDENIIEEDEEIVVEEVKITPVKKEKKEEPKGEEKKEVDNTQEIKEDNKQEIKEEKGFFGKIFSAIENFFSSLFS